MILPGQDAGSGYRNREDGMGDEWRYGLLRKFPALDPSWPEALQARWMQTFDRLLEMGQPPRMAGAKQDIGTGTPGPTTSHAGSINETLSPA